MSDQNDEPAHVGAEHLRERVARGERVTIVDVRSPEEFAAGHVDGAINIPAAELASRAGELDGNASIITVCNLGGARSCGAAEQLRALGHESATPLRGGMRGWHEAP